MGQKWLVFRLMQTTLLLICHTLHVIFNTKIVKHNTFITDVVP